jgi:exonuclease III
MKKLHEEHCGCDVTNRIVRPDGEIRYVRCVGIPVVEDGVFKGERDPLKVATFNINNINKRLDNLLAWLAKAEPDVVSLQELKAEQEAFPVDALRNLGYEAVCQGERSWNGVAILARNHVPVLTCTSLPGNSEDHQARYIGAAVQGVLITSIYLRPEHPRECNKNSCDTRMFPPQ